MKKSPLLSTLALGVSLWLSACGEKPEYHGAVITVAHSTAGGIKKKVITVIDPEGQVLCATGWLLEFPVTGKIQRTEESFQQVDGNPLWQEWSYIGTIHRTNDGRYTEVSSIGGDTILRIINQYGNGTYFPKDRRDLEEQKRNCEQSQ